MGPDPIWLVSYKKGIFEHRDSRAKKEDDTDREMTQGDDGYLQVKEQDLE